MSVNTTYYPIEQGTERPLGFPQDPYARGPAFHRPPTPLQRPRKGRWFVAVLLTGVTSFLVFNLWDSFFRHEAYGCVVARTIELSPPWAGAIRTVHVREGDHVSQGQVLVSLENIDLRMRQAQLSDEIALAQAELEAEVAKLKWEYAFGVDGSYGAVALHYGALADLLREESALEEVRIQFNRRKELGAAGAVTQEEVDSLRVRLKGQEEKTAKLRDAVNDLKARALQSGKLLDKGDKVPDGVIESGRERLNPFVMKITTLQAERARVQERLEEGQVRAPTNGCVSKILGFPGERCAVDERLMALLEDDSMEIVLYVPQKNASRHRTGDRVVLTSDDTTAPIEAVVRRTGDAFESPPEVLSRHYWQGQKLLPVHLTPPQIRSEAWKQLKVGGVVQLPRNVVLPWKGY